jgi:hypothetical protein
VRAVSAHAAWNRALLFLPVLVGSTIAGVNTPQGLHAIAGPKVCILHCLDEGGPLSGGTQDDNTIDIEEVARGD